MYQHHKESLENLKTYFGPREDVIALIFGGSVAKGCERPDISNFRQDCGDFV